MNNQLKKGVLEIVVLELLKNNEMYGYQVASYLDEHIKVKESSIYIILSRLQQNNYLTCSQRNNGRKIVKYYKTSSVGNEYLEELKNEMELLNNLIKEAGSYNEQK